METKTSNEKTEKNTECVADVLDMIKFCLQKNSEHGWHWAVLTPDVGSLLACFKSMLAETFPELAVKTVDLNKCPDYHSIRSTLNDAASGVGARVLIIEGLESKDEDTLNCGLGNFIYSLEDMQHRSYPEYTYGQNGLNIIVLLRVGTHNHFVKYTLSGSFAVLETA